MPDTNPYASPRAEQQVPLDLPLRERAQTMVRRSLLILAVPTAVNIWAIFFWNAGSDHLSESLRWTLVVANLLWFAFLLGILSLCGLWLIERLAGMLHFLFGSGVARKTWMNTLHESLWPMVPAALIGSLLWITWVCLFFLADHPGGFALDVVFQIAGHALGAWIFGNVFWHWYRLRSDGAHSLETT